MKTILPEQFKIVDGATKVTTTGGVTCDYISLKDAISVTIIAKLRQAVGHATALGVTEATNVSAGSASPVTEVQNVWKNADTSATDTLVKATNAATIAAAATVATQTLVMQFDPATLSAGFDCIAATLTDSSQATNWVDVTYIIETRYPQATPPSAIID
jgi:hypothetical protein